MKVDIDWIILEIKMFKKYMIIAVLGCLAGVVFGADENSKDGEAGQPPRSYFAIGGGAVVTDSYYKDEDTRVIPIPNIVYMSDEYYFTGLTAGKWLFGSREGFKMAAQVGGRLEYVDDSESDFYDGIDPRRPTLEAGLRAEYSFMESYNLRFDAMTDVMSEHDGYELSASISERIPAIFNNEKLTLEISAGVSWRSDNLNDHYFGVSSREARAGRPAYEADGGLNYIIGTSLNYQINDRWSWYNRVGVEFLSDEISDSPLVDSDYAVGVFTGVAYKL